MSRDNPEWTKEDFKKAKPASELPPKVKLTKFDIQDHLKTPEDRAAYLEAVIEGGDPERLSAAKRDIAKALTKQSTK